MSFIHIDTLTKEAGRDFRLVTIFIPKPQESINENAFRFSLDRGTPEAGISGAGALFASFQQASHRTRNRLGKLFAVDADRTDI